MIYRRFLPLLFLGCVAIGAESDFFEALRAYDSGDYAKAVELWKTQAKTGSGELHYNLGNAYYRMGSLGEAVFHFRKASELLPRDPDVNFNLKYVRGRTRDKISWEPSGIKAAIAWLCPWSVREAFILLVGSWVLFWFLRGILLFREWSWLRWLGYFVLVVAFYGGVSFFFSRSQASPFGTVTGAEIQVRSAIGKDGIDLFTLHEGAEFLILEQEGEWVRVALPDGKQGWTGIQGIRLGQSDSAHHQVGSVGS